MIEYGRPVYKVESLTDKWPTGLVGASEAAVDLFITPERLIDLANGGFAPHYRIDDGPPLFRKSELKEWAAKNLIKKFDAREFKAPFVQVVVEKDEYDHLGFAPTSIKRLNLKNITGDFRRSGIYFLCSNGRVVYVGQAVCVHSRVSTHMVTDKGDKVDAVFFLPWPAEDLNNIEGALIRALKPERNGKTRNGHMIAPVGEGLEDAKILEKIGFANV